MLNKMIEAILIGILNGTFMSFVFWLLRIYVFHYRNIIKK